MEDIKYKMQYCRDGEHGAVYCSRGKMFLAEMD